MNSNTCAFSKHISHDVAIPIVSKLPPKSVKPFSCAVSNKKYVPHDVALSVVSKLPPRSLKRFGSVSKSWALLPEDPHFMNMYRNNFVASNCEDDASFLLWHIEVEGGRAGRAAGVLDLVSGENRIMLDWPTLIQGNNFGFFMLDYVINGTLCLSTYRGTSPRDICQDKIVLWNPATQEFKHIPPGPKPETLHVRVLHGFGYDHVNQDYKVLQLINLKGQTSQTSWEIYSLKSNSRRTFELYIPFCPWFPCVDVYLNGMCHWLYWSGEGYGGKCVVSFDLSNEEFLVTPLPIGLGHASAHAPATAWFENHLPLGHTSASASTAASGSLKNHLVALNGSLALISNSEHSTATFHISILDQIGVRESWIKLLTIGPLPDLVRIVGTGKKGDILFKKNKGKLASLDLSTLMIKEVDVKGLSPYCFRIIIYQESLLPIGGIHDD